MMYKIFWGVMAAILAAFMVACLLGLILATVWAGAGILFVFVTMFELFHDA
jgi:hypothetical protein